MGTRFTRKGLVALIHGIVAVAAAGCGGGCDGNPSQTGGVGPSGKPATVIIAEFPQSGATEEILIDMDYPLPALVKLARLITTNCKQVPEATAEAPALLASWKLQAAPSLESTQSQEIPGTGIEVTCDAYLTSTFNSRTLVAGGPRGFAWCMSFEDGYHPVESTWQTSLRGAATEVAWDYAHTNRCYQVSMARRRKIGDLQQLEERLRAAEDALADKLSRRIWAALLSPD